MPVTSDKVLNPFLIKCQKCENSIKFSQSIRNNGWHLRELTIHQQIFCWLFLVTRDRSLEETELSAMFSLLVVQKHGVFIVHRKTVVITLLSTNVWRFHASVIIANFSSTVVYSMVLLNYLHSLLSGLSLCLLWWSLLSGLPLFDLI